MGKYDYFPCTHEINNCLRERQLAAGHLALTLPFLLSSLTLFLILFLCQTIARIILVASETDVPYCDWN